MSAPLLEIWNMNASYGRAQVLFGLSFQLYAGEVLALVGRNGAGKTTTLKAIMSLIPATAEKATFKGHSLSRLSTYRIARLGLGYVPEDRRIFTDLTVDENLEAGRKASSGRRRPMDAERVFELFPNLAEMRGPAGQPDVRRRAADAHHRPHPHGQPGLPSSSTSPPRASPR